MISVMTTQLPAVHGTDQRSKSFNQAQSKSINTVMASRKRSSSQLERNSKRPQIQSYAKRRHEMDVSNTTQNIRSMASKRTRIDPAKMASFTLSAPICRKPESCCSSTRRPLVLSFDEAEIFDFELVAHQDTETPVDELNDFDWQSRLSPSNGSERSYSEPPTPDGPTFGIQAPNGSMDGFIDLSFLGEAEREQIVVLAIRQKQATQNRLSYSSHDDLVYTTQLELTEPSMADFETAFMEFMNSS